MIVVLNKKDKEIVKEIAEGDEVALNILDNINEEIEKVAKKCNRLDTWGTILGGIFFVCSIIVACLNYDRIINMEIKQRIFWIALLLGGPAILFISRFWSKILEINAYKLTITEKELEYLNLMLKENAIEKKYSVKKQSNGKVWYYKAGKLMDAECQDKRQISNVVYREYYDLNKYSLDKKESFHHFEPALYNHSY